jgi:hypothetical protein
MVAKATPALQSSTAALLESDLKFIPVCDYWVSIAVLCQENDVGFNLYRLASDKKFSSENGEISYSSSHIHALLVQKIWGFYLVQEKSYWHKKTGQYFPRILAFSTVSLLSFLCLLYTFLKLLPVFDLFITPGTLF